VLLAAGGLIGADIAGYVMLRTFLSDRISESLTSGATRISTGLSVRPPRRITTGTLWRLSGDNMVSGDNVMLFFSRQGRLLFPPSASLDPQQAALVHEIGPLTAAARPRGGHLSQVSAGGVTYRIAYVPVDGPALVVSPPDRGPTVRAVVVATSLRVEHDTLARLASSEVIVTAIILLMLAGSAVVVLRLGLRPLGEMAAVATAIAGGQTECRIQVKPGDSEANRLAAALNRAFDERQRAEDRLRCFIADASHELRTPLSTIRGWAELYFQEEGLPDADSMHTAMSRIADEAARMGALVEDLLLLARLDQHPALASTLVDMVAVAREVVADAQVVDPSRVVTMIPAPDQQATILVRGDADRLRQVARNLIGNAFQHTPVTAAVRVTIVTRPDPWGRHQMCLSVADDGPGIPEDARHRLFDRFYRVGATHGHTDDHTDGHGLGLAIVRAIVQAHDGTVHVQSAAGRGSEFVVMIPAAEPHPPAQPGWRQGFTRQLTVS
jgi:two-component system OmpR family sensor kinase